MRSMIKSLRPLSTNLQSSIISHPRLSQKASVIRFKQVTTFSAASSDQQETKMEKDKANAKGNNKEEEPYDKSGDAMSHSFGEGYATRSEDDGFGGIYGGNDPNDNEDTSEKKSRLHENHPDYDKTQGSEVKERETARFQSNANRK